MANIEPDKNSKTEDGATETAPLAAQSVKKNFWYQSLYQVLILIIPFFIAPFLTRTLGADPLGEYNYAISYVTYFVSFAGLGIGKYGVRLITANKNNRMNLRKAFWSLYVVHFFSSILALGAYIIFAFFFYRTNTFYFIGIITVAAALFDTTFLFTGLENFRIVVLCNFAVKVLTTILTFTLIKSPNDVYLYAIIVACGVALSYLCLMPWIFKNIRPIKTSPKEWLVHIKPLLTLYIGIVAITSYTTFDKTILGLKNMVTEVAFYNYADKIIDLVKTLLSIAVTVTFPHVCSLIEDHKEKEATKFIDICIEFVTLLGIGSFFGLLALGKEIAVIYYGEEFAGAGVMLLWMSILPYLVGMNNIRVSLFMIPYHKDLQLTIVYVCASLLNIGVSFLLVNAMGSSGVIVGSIAVEFCNYVTFTIFSRKLISWKSCVFTVIPYGLFGGVMFVSLFLLKRIWSVSILHLVLLLLIGFTLYLALSLVYLFCFSRQKEYCRSLLAHKFRKRKTK